MKQKHYFIGRQKPDGFESPSFIGLATPIFLRKEDAIDALRKAGLDKFDEPTLWESKDANSFVTTACRTAEYSVVFGRQGGELLSLNINGRNRLSYQETCELLVKLETEGSPVKFEDIPATPIGNIARMHDGRVYWAKGACEMLMTAEVLLGQDRTTGERFALSDRGKLAVIHKTNTAAKVTAVLIEFDEDEDQELVAAIVDYHQRHRMVRDGQHRWRQFEKN